MKKTRKALLSSIISLVLCFSMLLGTTYAWFTDSATSAGNIIKSGVLDIEMYWTDDLETEDEVQWNDNSQGSIFNYENWEPGYTDVKYIKIVNEGNLAFRYALGVAADGAVTALADVIDVYCIESPTGNLTGRGDLPGTPVTNLKAAINGATIGNGALEKKDDEIILAIALKMKEDAGNEYQTLSLSANADGTPTTFSVCLMATQYTYEEDSFDNQYDAAAPSLEWTNGNVETSASVTADENGIMTADATLDSGEVRATVPAGTKVNAGTTTLTLTISKTVSSSDVTIGETEELLALDVHIEGIAPDNTAPVIVELGKVLPVGLNMGNLRLYHVENGETKIMTQVTDVSELDTHNEFYYDPATGNLTVAMATFSEVALVADTTAAWEGKVAEKFNGGSGTETDPYLIANADQLAYLGDRVSNDNANYGDKHYKLIADVNIGGSENYKENGVLFYPIGYNKVGGEVAALALDDLDEIWFEPINPAKPGDKDGDVAAAMADNSWYTYGGSFRGVFDGNGNKITGIYQNTWAMKGNYSGHYYNAAMGLFGYVNGGTVKNLTIDNFYSEGEFAPTGCVAAYAAGKATFENITITNSHPQTYNTGVAGIVGWDNGGDTEAEASNFTFRNITVDDSNTISALWGSWDVAAAGLLGYLGQYSKANFENCNVSATIDVYNDVCGNYQYYWYRYCGAFIGTVDKRLDNGKGALDLSNVTATNCTVNFGDRHEYYYCEFEKNTQASYTEDYQFSRVPHSELNMDANPVICTHTHTANEDKQAVYIPFRQLFGGYGWGVDGVDLDEYEEIKISDVTTSVEKFAVISDVDSFVTDTTLTLGEIFKAIDGKSIVTHRVQVFVSPVGDDSTVSAVYTPNTTDWTQGTLTFSGTGAAKIVITDYNYCLETTTSVTITKPEAVKKFDLVFENTDKYDYRVGNGNAVSVGSLFAAMDGATIGNVSVTVEAVDGTAASGTYSNDAIQFSGTGVVKVTITDNDYCIPTELTLEVVDAMNATSATSATKNNVVLLNDVGLHTIEVSNGYTLYGNGFKMEAKNDVMYDAMGVGFVTLKNGTLDNVQIICPNFSYAIVYNNQIKSYENTAVPSDSATNDARGNVRSAVMADGNSKIINSYIHGGRAAIFLRSGNLVVDGSTISGGATANIHTMSAQSLTLRNATLIQKPFKANVNDTSKTVMGFSGLFECDESGNATPVILEGTLIQDAWINESYTEYVPSAATSIVNVALDKKDYIHDLDGDGTNESLNLGFVYIPQNTGGSTNANVTDNRTNKNSVPYAAVDVGNVLASAKVFSYKNTSGTSEDFIIDGDFKPSVQGTTAPTVSFTDTNADRVFETAFDTSDNRWESTLTVNLDNGDYTFSWDKLSVQKHGENLTYTVKTADGTVVDTLKAIALTSSSVTTYVLTVTDGDATHTVYFVISATKTSIPEPEKADTTGGTPLLVVKSKNSDWSCAIPALDGIKIKYYTSANNSVILDLATLTPTSTGKQNGTNNYWEYSNGYTLKVTCGVIHDTKQVYGMPVVVDNNGTKQMYFVITSTNGYVSTGTSARSVTVTYDFTDPNGKTLTFSNTYNVKYADYKDVAQYSYSDFVKGTMTDLLTSSSGSSDGCVTPDTLITLADGSQVRVDSLTGSEELLVWNMETGALDAAPILFVDNDPEAAFEVVKLFFSDGTDVQVIYEHGFWDYDLNKYVYLDANAADYIGHTFAKQNGDRLERVQLVDVVLETQVTTAWSPVTVGHLCYFVNDMLSMPGGVGGLFNIFDVDAETMTYDYAAMAQDMEEYGLFTYEELNAIEPLSEDMFDAAGGAYLKISMGKGNLTMDELVTMIRRYSKFF